MTSKSAIDQLTDEYTTYLGSQGLPLECADEILASPNLTPEQRAWVSDFCHRWNAADAADPEFFDKQTVVEG